jgi:hypothetical protein
MYRRHQLISHLTLLRIIIYVLPDWVITFIVSIHFSLSSDLTTHFVSQLPLRLVAYNSFEVPEDRSSTQAVILYDHAITLDIEVSLLDVWKPSIRY